MFIFLDRRRILEIPKLSISVALEILKLIKSRGLKILKFSIKKCQIEVELDQIEPINIWIIQDIENDSYITKIRLQYTKI